MKVIAKKTYAAPSVMIIVLQHKVCLLETSIPTEKTEDTNYDSDLGW